jgi:hypothetical protein
LSKSYNKEETKSFTFWKPIKKNISPTDLKTTMHASKRKAVSKSTAVFTDPSVPLWLTAG